MTLFEVLIICIVAAMFVATIFMFTVCISNIKQVHITNKQVVTLTNAIFECRSFLEKLSKHDVIVKINNINGLEKKIGELLTICRNQTNNITSVKESLDNVMNDITMRNNSIKDIHKLSDSINIKTNKMKDDINKIEEIVININKPNLNKYDKTIEDITYLKEKVGEVSVDSEKEIIKINDKLEDILSFTKRCNSGISALIEAHNGNIDIIRESFKGINDTLSNFSDVIDNIAKSNKINNDEIAKISSILDTYREKVNYMTTWIENATKLKTASKTKMVKTKTTTTPIIKK